MNNAGRFLMIFGLIFLFGCQKEDVQSPVISVELLSKAEPNTLGDTVKLRVIITDDGGIDNYQITPEIYGANTESVVNEISNKSREEFEYSYVILNQPYKSFDTTLLILIKATDREGNSSLMEFPLDVVPFTIHENYYIDSDETWGPGIHYIKTSLNVEDANTLTIEPGAEIRFGEYATLEILNGGTLIAKGTADNNIIFTANTDDPHPGFWIGLRFSASNDVPIISELEYCRIEYAGISSDYGPIYIHLGNVTIKNCIISDFKGPGIFSYGGVGEIDNNIIKNNVDDHLIEATFSQLAMIGPDNILESTQPYYGIEFLDIKMEDDFTLIDLSVPYYISTSLEIKSNLTIEPGVVILLGGRFIYETSKIKVTGSITAIGTEDKRISFLLSELSKPTHWAGIAISTPHSPSNLTYCDISHGGNFKGNLFLWETANLVTISNCRISNSSNYGIYIDSESTPILENNTFSQNQSGDIYQQ